VGQRDLYPFAILFREFPVDRHEELIRRAMRWPEPLDDDEHEEEFSISEFRFNLPAQCGLRDMERFGRLSKTSGPGDFREGY
jgi:hypothetical protein